MRKVVFIIFSSLVPVAEKGSLAIPTQKSSKKIWITKRFNWYVMTKKLSWTTPNSTPKFKTETSE